MSGVRDLEDVAAFYATDDSTLVTHADVVHHYLMVEPSWTPGFRFRYNNADFIILGAILEQVSGRSFAALLRDRILIPLKLHDTGIVRESDIVDRLADGLDVDSSGRAINAPSPVQRFMASGAKFSTAPDLLRWNQALAHHTLLSAASTNRTPGARDRTSGLDRCVPRNHRAVPGAQCVRDRDRERRRHRPQLTIAGYRRGVSSSRSG